MKGDGYHNYKSLQEMVSSRDVALKEASLWLSR